jgi:hypothetical protein
MLRAELEDRAWEVTTYPLREMDIRHCLGCFGCWIKTPGVCVINDAARDLAPAVLHSDLVIYFTPLTFGGYSSELKKALDRLICLIAPDFMLVDGEVHHKPRYERYPRLLGVGLADRADPESERIFRTLIERNAINMHSPARVSGVVHSELGSAGMRAEVQQLLQGAGVRQ